MIMLSGVVRVDMLQLGNYNKPCGLQDGVGDDMVQYGDT